MKTPPLILAFVCLVALTGCSAKVQTSLQSDGVVTPMENSEPLIDPQSIGSEAESQADTTIQAPAPSESDDISDIQADLDTTVIVNEQFE